MAELQKRNIETKAYVYKAIYDWYLQQNIVLEHSATHRSHFCLLLLIQKYLDFNLLEHQEDSESIVLSDKYKNEIKCNSTTFNNLFRTYFKETVEGSRTGTKVYATGYRLKEKYMDELFDIIYPSFSTDSKMEYVEIDNTVYEDIQLFKTQKGWVRTKKEALKIEGLTRRKEEQLESKRIKVLKPKKANDKDVYKVDFNIPSGYSKYSITINREELIDLVKNKSRDKQTLLLYMRIINIYNVFKFSIYKSVSTGRLNGTTNINGKFHSILINYQGLKKTLRKDIFNGMYEYDIATAAPVVLLQLYKQKYTKTLQYVDDYIANKEAKRIHWAKLLDGNLDDNVKKVKAVLTSLFFGAKLDNPNFISIEVAKTISKSELRRLHKDSSFKLFLDDVVYLFKELGDSQLKFKVGAKTKVVKNKLGVSKKFTRREKNKAIAFLYQGIEVQILLAVYKKYKDKISLLIHDAVIATEPLDLNELSRVGFKESGYRVTFEEEVVKS